MAKKSDFLKPWLSSALETPFPSQDLIGRLVFNMRETVVPPADVLGWQKEHAKAHPHALLAFETDKGPVLLVSPFLKGPPKTALRPNPWLESSPFAKVRDAAGQALQIAVRSGVAGLEIHLPRKAEDIQAALVGFEISSYRFRPAKDQKPLAIRLRKGTTALDKKSLERAELVGWCTNVARHLVNMPPNELNPKSFADIAKELSSGIASVKAEVWNADRLKKENMNLLLAVGAGSDTPPCLVHLRYRPGRAAKKGKTVALVGKGITFDSGGLDLKTAAGMRLMKKDMGGGAAVLAAFLWAAKSKAPVALDAYISLAENSVGPHAFRPSDVYTSRDGQTVEISNTDAEGRLVLADALNVAVSAKGADEPSIVINVATLTGAIKVGLGAALSGLFSNHQPLSDQLNAEFWKAGDNVWPMPLYQKYRSAMGSYVADMTNSVETPFGGAVTAALFLESFVKDKPWAHLDIYGWKDGADGAWSEAGGSGQSVLGLIKWLSSKKA